MNPETSIKTIGLNISFDAEGFNGWSNHSTLRTIASVLQDSLTKVARCQADITPCISIIDGCHAVHFIVWWNNVPQLPDQFLHKVNRCLPNDIVIRDFFSTKNTNSDSLELTYEYLFHKIQQPFLKNRSCYIHPFPIQLSQPSLSDESIKIQWKISSNFLIIRLTGKQLSPQQALEITTTIVSAKTLLPAYGLYITHCRCADFSPDYSPTLSFPEPKWFLSENIM
ncbi:MAG: hypothetical protein PHR53_02310 [Bacteroidales bacterium]|nr:hypothetical protein [Bacteroidales bacterium]